ncbi:MAG: STAS domain-containing protein [Actinomycetota bacterium]
MDGPLTIEVTEKDGRCVIVLRGELDISSAERFDRLLADLDVEGDIVADLSGLDFMDSTGIRFLLRMNQQVLGAGHVLRIVPGGPAVQRVFELAGIQDRLPPA